MGSNLGLSWVASINPRCALARDGPRVVRHHTSFGGVGFSRRSGSFATWGVHAPSGKPGIDVAIDILDYGALYGRGDGRDVNLDYDI